MSEWIKRNKTLLAVALGLLVVEAIALQWLMGAGPPIAAGLFVLFAGMTWAIHWFRGRRTPASGDQINLRSVLINASIALVATAVVIQPVPYGRSHSNPAVTAEPEWDSPRTRELTVRACYDCHSNEVDWPWYSNVAPVSWAVTMHVDEGRDKLNFSEWDRPQREADEAAGTVEEGSMPPPYFTRFANGDARLTDAEKQELIRGLEATFGSEGWPTCSTSIGTNRSSPSASSTLPNPGRG